MSRFRTCISKLYLSSGSKTQEFKDFDQDDEKGAHSPQGLGKHPLNIVVTIVATEISVSIAGNS
jgi:hypothetical protein